VSGSMANVEKGRFVDRRILARMRFRPSSGESSYSRRRQTAEVSDQRSCYASQPWRLRAVAHPEIEEGMQRQRACRRLLGVSVLLATRSVPAHLPGKALSVRRMLLIPPVETRKIAKEGMT
jgi:hypothetical protein